MFSEVFKWEWIKTQIKLLNKYGTKQRCIKNPTKHTNREYFAK